nr:translation initiation factor eIF-2B subunit alpha [Seculamonas ecuadoriensis]
MSKAQSVSSELLLRAVEAFQEWQSDAENSIASAAARGLVEIVKGSAANTIMGLKNEFEYAIQAFVAAALERSRGAIAMNLVSLRSGGEIFARAMTNLAAENKDFAKVKVEMEKRGMRMAMSSVESREKIAHFFSPFLRDGMRILLHGYSRVAIRILSHAVKSNKRISCYVTETRPFKDGEQNLAALKAAGIAVTMILDSAVARVIDSVDFVLVGAEGVMENGAVINKIGTLQTAVIAKASHKPFYVACEMVKFVRKYPLTQEEATEIVVNASTPSFSTLSVPRSPSLISASPSASASSSSQSDGSAVSASPQFSAAPSLAASMPALSLDAAGVSNLVKQQALSAALEAGVVSEDTGSMDVHVHDLTSPEYVTLLFTDLGILTPSAVSDHLINFYS